MDELIEAVYTFALLAAGEASAEAIAADAVVNASKRGALPDALTALAEAYRLAKRRADVEYSGPLGGYRFDARCVLALHFRLGLSYGETAAIMRADTARVKRYLAER